MIFWYQVALQRNLKFCLYPYQHRQHINLGLVARIVNLFGLVTNLPEVEMMRLEFDQCTWVFVMRRMFNIKFKFLCTFLFTQQHWKYIYILYHFRSPIQNFINSCLCISGFAFMHNTETLPYSVLSSFAYKLNYLSLSTSLSDFVM